MYESVNDGVNVDKHTQTFMNAALLSPPLLTCILGSHLYLHFTLHASCPFLDVNKCTLLSLFFLCSVQCFHGNPVVRWPCSYTGILSAQYQTNPTKHLPQISYALCHETIFDIFWQLTIELLKKHVDEICKHRFFFDQWKFISENSRNISTVAMLKLI